MAYLQQLALDCQVNAPRGVVRRYAAPVAATAAATIAMAVTASLTPRLLARSRGTNQVTAPKTPSQAAIATAGCRYSCTLAST